MTNTGDSPDEADNTLGKADPTGQSGAPVAVAIFVGVLVLVLLVLVIVGVVVLG